MAISNFAFLELPGILKNIFDPQLVKSADAKKLWIWRAGYTLKYALSQLLLLRKPGLRQEHFGMTKKFVYVGHPNNLYLFKSY